MKTGRIALTIFFLVVASLIEARVLVRGAPIFTLAILMPLSLVLDTALFVPIAFLTGIFRDGLFPQHLWVSPFAFVLCGLIGHIFRGYVNLKLFAPKLAYFIVFTLLYSASLAWVHGTCSSVLDIVSTTLSTALVAVFVLWIIR